MWRIWRKSTSQKWSVLCYFLVKPRPSLNDSSPSLFFFQNHSESHMLLLCRHNEILKDFQVTVSKLLQKKSFFGFLIWIKNALFIKPEVGVCLFTDKPHCWNNYKALSPINCDCRWRVKISYVTPKTGILHIFFQ